MTRCHCTDTPFEEVARRVRAGRSFEQAQLESGAGLLCSACLPDLRDHLAGIAGSAEAEAEAETETDAAAAPGPTAAEPTAA